MSEKHKAPKICHIRRALVGASPSAMLSRCTLGLRSRCRKCKGCEHNVGEIWLLNFEKGLGTSKKVTESTRQVKTYTTSFMGCLTWDHDKGELHPTREEELKEECAHQMVKSLIREGAIRFAFKEYNEPPPPLCPPRILCTATLDVVMPEKEEAET